MKPTLVLAALLGFLCASICDAQATGVLQSGELAWYTQPWPVRGGTPALLLVPNTAVNPRGFQIVERDARDAAEAFIRENQIDCSVDSIEPFNDRRAALVLAMNTGGNGSNSYLVEFRCNGPTPLAP